MTDLITSVNAEIANNQLEEKVTNIQAALHSKLKMLAASWHSLHVKTIKECHKDYGTLTLLFTDGEYFVAKADDDAQMEFTTMDLFDGFKYGLLSEDEHQELKLAEAATDCVRCTNTGVSALHNAIAYLGIDAVKTLVNMEERT